MPSLTSEPQPLYVSRSSRGWKVLAASGRTVARFEGRFAHRHATRFVRDREAQA